MTHLTAGASRAPAPPSAPEDAPAGQPTDLAPRPVRHAARAGTTRATERPGVGGGAGPVGLLGVAALATTAILLLDVVLPAWTAALVVTAVLFAVAGAPALLGGEDAREVTPPAPTGAVAGMTVDVATGEGSLRR